MNKVRLKLKGVSEIVGSSEVALLVLTDEQESRQLSVVCDKAMAYELSMRLGDAPVNPILLPEVLCRVAGDMDELHYEVLINGLVEGQYRAVLLNKFTFDMIPIRVSDGVLLSLIARLPLFIEQNLMNRQSVAFKQGTNGVAIPVNTLSNDMLKEALETAIGEENYELASHLRDEMRRRKWSKDNPDNADRQL